MADPTSQVAPIDDTLSPLSYTRTPSATQIKSHQGMNTDIPIPELDYTVDISTESTLHTSLLYIYAHTFVADHTTLLIESSTVPMSSILNISTVQGGITNQLYKISLTDKYIHYSRVSSEPVLIRIFGAKTEYIINRPNESIIVTYLHNINYSCQIYAKFNNGRIEQFLSGAALEPVEMSYPHIQPLIANKLYSLHTFDLSRLLHRHCVDEVAVCESIEKWIEYIKQNTFTDAEKQKVFDTLNFTRVITDYYSYKSKLLHQHSITPYAVGFCHNDLLSGNVIYDQQQNIVHLIDYEYSNYNYYAYDIANHFAEYSGFECDWNNYPTEQQQIQFITHYVKQRPDDSIDQYTVNELQQQVRQFSLMPHYYWGIWAVVQAHISNVDFDYIYYAHRKLVGGIEQHKQWCYTAFK